MIFLLVPILAFIPAIVAGSKGRNPFGWYLYGLLLFPLAFIHALLASPNKALLDREAVASGASKVCPHCAEIIKREAKVCRYCGRDI